MPLGPGRPRPTGAKAGSLSSTSWRPCHPRSRRPDRAPAPRGRPRERAGGGGVGAICRGNSRPEQAGSAPCSRLFRSGPRAGPGATKPALDRGVEARPRVKRQPDMPTALAPPARTGWRRVAQGGAVRARLTGGATHDCVLGEQPTSVPPRTSILVGWPWLRNSHGTAICVPPGVSPGSGRSLGSARLAGEPRPARSRRNPSR